MDKFLKDFLNCTVIVRFSNGEIIRGILSAVNSSAAIVKERVDGDDLGGESNVKINMIPFSSGAYFSVYDIE